MRVLRKPAQETRGLYPKLVVWDARQTGSITVGRSRLPLWAIVGDFGQNGWEGVVQGWPQIEEDYHYTREDFVSFIYDVLELRGEFARLLLMLANAERTDREEQRVFPETPWWEDGEITSPIRDQLQRCLDALSGVAS